MTENEAIEIIQTEKQCLDKSTSGQCKVNCGDCKENIPIACQKKAYEMAISALEGIQQYQEIGTVEECLEAVEKLPDAEDTIRKLMCGEYGSSCQFCIYDNDEDAMCCNIGGSGSWCCENAQWNGKSE